MGRQRDDEGNESLDVGMDEAREREIREEAQAWAEDQVQTGATSTLTIEMLRAIYVMVHPLTGNSILGWSRIADVDRKSWYRHRSKPEWQATVDRLRAERRQRQLALADRVIEELTGGDVDPKIRLAAARTIYEREGQFVRRVETTQVTETPAEREQRRAMQQRAQQHQDGKPLH